MGRPQTCGCTVCPKCKRRDYMRRWYRKTRRTYVNLEKRREYDNRRWRDDPEYRARHAARMALAQRVRRGLIVRGECALCRSPETIGHHNDYSRPLDATWLCRTCHDIIHGPLPVEVPA
jgi:hypothetical protein